MIVYYLMPILIVVVSFPLFLIKKVALRNLLICIFFGLVLVLFSGLKSTSVGHDTLAYNTMYDYLAKSQWTIKYHNFEIGYVLLAELFAKIGLSFNVFCIFIYALIYFFISIFIYKTSRFPLLSFFALFGLEYFAFALSGQRQAISISIAIISLLFMNKKGIKNLFFSIVIILVSASFHRTSLFFLIIPFIKIMRLKFGKNTFFYSILVFMVAFIFSKQIYQFFIFFFPTSAYLTIDNNGGGFFFMLLIIYCCIYFAYNNEMLPFLNNEQRNKIFKKDDLLVRDRTIENYKNLFFFAAMMAVFFYASSPASSSFSRVSLLFIIPFSVLISNAIIDNFSKKYALVLIAFSFVFFYLIYVFTIVRANYLEITPYKLLF